MVTKKNTLLTLVASIVFLSGYTAQAMDAKSAWTDKEPGRAGISKFYEKSFIRLKLGNEFKDLMKKNPEWRGSVVTWNLYRTNPNTNQLEVFATHTLPYSLEGKEKDKVYYILHERAFPQINSCIEKIEAVIKRPGKDDYVLWQTQKDTRDWCRMWAKDLFGNRVGFGAWEVRVGVKNKTQPVIKTDSLTLI